jgi:class I fructose-bisphosphate aldolase
MTDAVRRILDNYRSQPPGVLANLARILGHGRLAGTGKLVILPVDQGFEHGPARSFSDNPAGYDPHYHFELAVDAGCNAYAAPLGFLEAGAAERAGEIPLILKLNNHDSLSPDGDDPVPSVTGSVADALYLGCSAIGFTIYPGSAHFKSMYEELRELAEEAKSSGLAVVVWSYPRGSGISKKGETAIDVVAYAAQVAAQMGAHLIKVKLPSEHIENDSARKKYQEHKIPIDTVANRVRHVVQSAFDGRRIVIFSGGSKASEDSFYRDIRGIYEGGGFGSIIGRNSFQRPKAEAIRFLHAVMDIYEGKSAVVVPTGDGQAVS